MNRAPMANPPRGRKWKLPRPVRISLGVLLLLGGIVGLVLPVLQGMLMIVAALAILRQDIPCVARLWDRHLGPRWDRWGAQRWERSQEWFHRTVRRRE